tara:strand:+ start:2385 stop:4130 length:1746 start_codon:yes stop_codon:yes gene_type:complete
MIVFEKVRWKNFLSTGNTFSEINLNGSRTNLIVGHNGSGKSTILDALTFSLFGKPFRKISKGMLVNSVNEKDTMVEIEFSIGKNQYKIARGIKPNKFEIYCNGKMWNEDAKAVDQQKNLEQNVLKMNYKSFTQIVVLGSSTFVPFMRLPGQQRREIIEDILDIQVFSVMNTRLKDKIRENRDVIKELDYNLHLLDEKIELQKKYMLEIQKKNEAEIDRKKERISVYLQEELESNEKIEQLSKEIATLTTQMEECSNSTGKLKQLNTFLVKLEGKLNKCKKEHEFYSNNEICPTCNQDLDKNFVFAMTGNLDTKIKDLNNGYDELKKAISSEEERNNRFVELSQQVNTVNTSIAGVNYQLITIRNLVSALDNEIKELESSNPDKKKEYNKLEELLTEKNTVKNNYADSKKDCDVLQAATQLLKDSGIKTRIIKTYLPTMNKLINGFLQSMDFYVNFTLDENFEETIKSRYRDVFSYESFSEGEKARIDIALLLTWRSIAKLKNSVDTNLLILDEIFDGSLDQSGTSDLGWILRNFDENTNVFVISHKSTLDDKFDRTISVSKDKNYSVLEETVHEVTHALIG